MTTGDLMRELWDSLQLGEIVLVERMDLKDQYFGLYQLMSWGRSKGYTVLIIDVVDSFHILTSKARLAGLDCECFDTTHVIKIGGRVKRGNVIAWISDLTEPVILIGKFKEAYERFLKENAPVLTIALGVEKLFVTSDVLPKSVHLAVSLLSEYVGNRDRLAVHLVKAPLLGEEHRYLLNLIEDIATTIIRVSSHGRIGEFKVVKSIKRDVEGLTIRA